jgi:hypothetical protein
MMKLAAAIILVVGLSTTAQAVETGTLTLACKGTVVDNYNGPEPEQLSMGLIVNFTTGAVEGFILPDIPKWGYYPVNIERMNEVIVTFSGSGGTGGINSSMSGTIDRVTGDVDASHTDTDAKTGKMLNQTTYSLKCRPTQRLF